MNCVRKLFFCCIFFILATRFFAAENSVSLKNAKPRHSVLVENMLLTDRYNFPKNVYFQGSYLYDAPIVTAGGGVQFGTDKFDLQGSGVFWFLRTNHQKLGAGLVYHLNVFKDISSTNDLLAGLYYKCQPIWWFSFLLNFNYFFKSRTVFEIANYVPALINNSLGFSVRFDFYPIKYISFYLEMATYEKFRYQFFLSPIFMTGVSINFSDSCSIVFSLKAIYQHFLVLSAGHEYNEFSFGMRFSF